MDRFVAYANIDHFLGILTTQTMTDCNRETVIKLMIAEVDRLGSAPEHREFAQSRASRCRDRLDYLRRLRDAFTDGTENRARAEKLLADFQTTHDLMEDFRRRLRETVRSGTL